MSMSTKTCVMLMNNERTERSKLRGKIVTKGRTELNAKKRKGTYIKWLKDKYGVMDMSDILLDKEFLNDMKDEIEKNRRRALVYTPAYRRQYLDEWLEIRDKKERMRIISERIKSAGGPREGSYDEKQ